jgi:hypothetical protein
MEFNEFPKITRLSRECIITEKIDGTNSCICITQDEFLVGSRSRWITPEQDNFGFARWSYAHKEELINCLGIGTHYGEWWGSGIQRGYGLVKGEKVFSLFNTKRWSVEPLFDGCRVVPVIYQGIFDTKEVDNALELLSKYGSLASPGFRRPEGVVVYHVAGNLMFKKTIEKDETPKTKLI